MRVDNEFLMALSNKLIEISENCVDVDTQSELNELIDNIAENIQ
jgi:hypothetical protein